MFHICSRIDFALFPLSEASGGSGAHGMDAGGSSPDDACGPAAGWSWSRIRLPPSPT